MLSGDRTVQRRNNPVRTASGVGFPQVLLHKDSQLDVAELRHFLSPQRGHLHPAILAARPVRGTDPTGA